MAPSLVSSVKYWSSVLPAEKGAERHAGQHQPAGTDIPFELGDDDDDHGGNRAAHKGAEGDDEGLLMVMAVVALAELTTPPPNITMPTAAPKAAPWDTPRVEAEARDCAGRTA